MLFQVGENVVVCGCGVGVVEAVQIRKVGGENVELYHIEFDDVRGSVWVPTDRVEGRLRAVMSKERVGKTWQVIARQEAPERGVNWNRRQRAYNEKLLSNKPMELAELFGELAAVEARARTNNKTLSFGERGMLDKVRRLLAEEIAAALGEPTEAVEARMDTHLSAAA